MKIDTVRHLLFVGYFVDEKTTSVGTAQAFEFQSGQLLIQSLEHDRAEKNKFDGFLQFAANARKFSV